MSGAERLSRDSCGMHMHFFDKSMTPVCQRSSSEPITSPNRNSVGNGVPEVLTNFGAFQRWGVGLSFFSRNNILWNIFHETFSLEENFRKDIYRKYMFRNS